MRAFCAKVHSHEMLSERFVRISRGYYCGRYVYLVFFFLYKRRSVRRIRLELLCDLLKYFVRCKSEVYVRKLCQSSRGYVLMSASTFPLVSLFDKLFQGWVLRTPSTYMHLTSRPSPLNYQNEPFRFQ